MKIAAFCRVAAVSAALAGLAGCGTNPVTIATDDDALCRYAAEAGSAESAATCRSRLADAKTPDIYRLPPGSF